MQMKTDNQTSNQLLGGGLLFVVVESSGKRTRVHVLLSVVMLAYDDNLLTAPSKLSTEERARAAPWLYVHVPTRTVFRQILVLDPVITTAHVNQMRVLWGVY